MNATARLHRALGYQFNDPALLERALTHRSAGKRNNERLEFLGDSIVNHVIAEALFHRFPTVREGSLSRMRSSLVKGVTLAELARELQLGDNLKLGSGERKSGGHRRDSILADTLEAVAGAILLDGGYAACCDCLLRWFDSRLAAMTEDSGDRDPKTRLQEYLQGRGLPLPDYTLVAVEGDDHAREFEVACRLTDSNVETRGQGSSRRSAEQAAAEAALVSLADG
jgi:ribonuclease-3